MLVIGVHFFFGGGRGGRTDGELSFGVVSGVSLAQVIVHWVGVHIGATRQIRFNDGAPGLCLSVCQRQERRRRLFPYDYTSGSVIFLKRSPNVERVLASDVSDERAVICADCSRLVQERHQLPASTRVATALHNR